MTAMAYDAAAAERLEAIYRGADVAAQRAHTLRLMRITPGDHVIDIGSGPGFLAAEIAAVVGDTGHVLGIDLAAAMVDRASRRNPDPWITFRQADATALPAEDASFDIAVSTQVAEYVADIDAFCAEAHRVLKPGGRIVILATDWEAIAWHSQDPSRMKAVLQAFAPHCAHISLPRTLATRLRAAGFTVDRVSAYPILNTNWSDENYSCQAIPFIAAYVSGKGHLPSDLLDAWAAEQFELGVAGQYYFLTNRIFFEASKPGAV